MSVLPQRRLFTVEEYERMVEAGILHEDDRVELIEGEIVEMTPINPPHFGTVNRVTELLIGHLRGRATVAVQGPVRLFPRSMPEPDFSVLVPRDDFYSTALPQPSDIYLVIEVSDTSLRYDRDRKLPLYGRYGVREMWVVDIPHSRLIVARRPGPDGYDQITVVARGETVTPEAFPDLVLAAEDILG